MPLVNTMGWSVPSVTLAFTIMIVLGGGSAALFGRLVEKMAQEGQPSLLQFFGLGQAGSGFAVTIESLTLFLLTYGLLSGLGLGIGYIAPVSTLVKWFPDHRG